MKHKKWLQWGVWLLTGLFVTNIVTIYLLFSQNNKAASTSSSPERTELFVLEGEDSGDARWKIEDYKVIKTSDASIWRGSGKITYLGNEADLNNISYFSYRFYEQQEGRPSDTVLGGSISSNSSVAIPKVRDVGTISGAATPLEQLLTREDMDRSYLEIEWKDHLGKVYKDRIELTVKEYETF